MTPERLAEITEASDVSRFRATMQVPGSKIPELSPAIVEVARLLISEPLLQQPCVEWCRNQLAAIARAKLEVLYGAERTAQMISQAQQ